MPLLNHCCKELFNSQEQAKGTKKRSKTGRQSVSASNYDFSHLDQYNNGNGSVVIIH